MYWRIKGNNHADNGFATRETTKACRLYFVWLSRRNNIKCRRHSPHTYIHLAHVPLVTCEFNKLTLNCLMWLQSYPVHLGYMYKGKKNPTQHFLDLFPIFIESFLSAYMMAVLRHGNCCLLFIAGVFKWIISPDCMATLLSNWVRVERLWLKTKLFLLFLGLI